MQHALYLYYFNWSDNKLGSHLLFPTSLAASPFPLGTHGGTRDRTGDIHLRDLEVASQLLLVISLLPNELPRSSQTL